MGKKKGAGRGNPGLNARISTSDKQMSEPLPTILKDRYGRVIRDLRISVTERCNFRCSYCKPLFGFSEKYRPELMTFEEITRFAGLFGQMGVQKLRLTGGEPLLRRELEVLIKMLSQVEGIEDIAMTTNAFFLEQKAELLKEAGLTRLTISMDSLRKERFHEMTSTQSFDRVMRGIEKAKEVGFFPLRINMVVMRGINEDEIVDFAHFARDTGHMVRFIEFMPLDSGKTWDQSQVVTQEEILEHLRRVGPLEELGRSYSSETASRFRYADGKGELGIIAPVSVPFCGQCSRLRLSADGRLRTCLFSAKDHSLLDQMRAGATDHELCERISELTWNKEAGHRINQPDFVSPNRSMSLIGG